MASDKDYRKLELAVITMQSYFLRALERVEQLMSTIVEDLKAEVAKNVKVTESAVALMSLLTEKLQAGLDNRDLEQIQDVVDSIRNDTKVLGDAVAANTPAASEVKPDGPGTVSGDVPPVVVPPVVDSAPLEPPVAPPSPIPDQEPTSNL